MAGLAPADRYAPQVASSHVRGRKVRAGISKRNQNGGDGNSDYHPSMTPRQFRIGAIALSAASVGLGISGFVERKYGTGAFWLVISVAWMLHAIFRNNTLRMHERRRRQLETKYASRPIPAQPDSLPRWFSPDQPPGWYLNPATDEPAYWSEIGWRRKDARET